LGFKKIGILSGSALRTFIRRDLQSKSKKPCALCGKNNCGLKINLDIIKKI